MATLVEPPAKHARLREPSADGAHDNGRSQFQRLTGRITWPEHLLPADVEVSFGWEQDPREDVLASAGTAKLSSDLLLSPDESDEEEQEPQKHSASTSLLQGTSANATKGTQIALLIRSHSQGWARSFELHRNWPRPAIVASDEVLLRNVSMGLNPVDFKSLLYKFGIERFPWVLGRDVCGVVEQVGSDVKHLQKGQRVWTCSDSRDVRAGAYQAYSVSKAFTLGTLPDEVSDEEAATIGTGLVTAGVALYWFFGLLRPEAIGGGPFSKGKGTPATSTSSANPQSQTPWLLIFGGGAITGIYAAQLAHLSGVRVISVASPENFEYLHSIGVDVCVDRYGSEAEILNQVNQAVRGGEGSQKTPPGRLLYALDCVGSTTAALCQRALQDGAHSDGPSPQLICLAGNPKRLRDSDETSDATRAQVITHRISFSTTFYGQQEFTAAFLSAVHALFASKSLKPVRAQLVPHGLAGVRTGLEMLRNGAAPRAKKLVVRMQDTPDVELTNLGVKEELSWNGCI